MAALNFPASPSVDDLYTANGSTWKWDGTSWNVVPANLLLGNLGDVTLTSLATNDLIKYNGSNWVNSNTIDGTVIGGSTAAAGTFTTLTASSISYPTSDGTVGQVLATDGSGTLSFADAGAGDKIEEGNSSVEVVDAGTGYVAVTVDGTETARFVDNGDLRFNSGYGSVATAYGCRAWVFFDGVGTVSIRDSGNVSSITDAGTGHYTVNLTNAMPDKNFTALVTGTTGGTNSGYAQLDSTGFGGAGVEDEHVSTSSFNIRSVESDGILRDHPMIHAAVFR